MGHSDEWTFADYFKYEKEIYRAIISAAVLCQWIAEHDTPPTDGEAEELAREIDRRLCEAWGEIFSLAVLKWRDSAERFAYGAASIFWRDTGRTTLQASHRESSSLSPEVALPSLA